MVRKMTYAQWEFLLDLYQMNSTATYGLIQNKKFLQRCIEKGYIEESADGAVRITEFGIDSAKKDHAELYRRI